MATHKRASIHIALVLASLATLLSSPALPESGAAIQVTAHVEAPLGMFDAEIELEGRNNDTLPGSHLYWLYYPRQEGVLLQISHPSTTGADDSLSSPAVLARFYPDLLREYPQAALVDLGGATMSVGASADVTLTLIFTDN